MLLQPGEDAVELLEARVRDGELARAAGLRFDRHLGAERLRERFLEAREIGIGGARIAPAAAPAGMRELMDEPFGFAHRQPLRDHARGRRRLLSRRQREERARMAHVELSAHQVRLHRFRELAQAQEIADGAARASHGLRGGVVGEAEFGDQAMNAVRLLERVQILALDVLDERRAPAPIDRAPP